jgi:ribonuclease HI
MPERRRAWTDGACKGNPGPGGWAWVDDAGRWERGAEARSTNQRMEIMAAYRAVLAHDEPLTVISDSTYVVNCFRDGWWRGWLAKDWKNSQRKPVANRDLWEPFIELYQARDDVRFEWVKGHAGDEMNDIADRLAVAAAEDQRSASGDAVPDDLGAADVPQVQRPHVARC